MLTPENADLPEVLPFSEVWQPLVSRVLDTVREELGVSATRLAAPAWDSLCLALARRVSVLVSPGLLIEFKVWRAQARPGHPPSRDSDELYRTWLREKLVVDLSERLALRPMGKKLLNLVIAQWRAAVLELLRRLEADGPRLRTYFRLDPGRVIEIQAEASDYHNHGRAVLLLTFADGTKLAYKPRDLALEQRWMRFLGWINHIGQPTGLLPLRRLRILSKSGYGWMEFVSPQPCASTVEAAQFSHRCGMLLALWTLVGGTDLHMENLGACGADPVLFDAETLMDFADDDPRYPEYWLTRTYLLPVANLPEEILSVDALGAWERRLGTHPAWQWREIGTDAIHTVCERRWLQNPLALLRLTTPGGWWKNHFREMAAGFGEVMRLLAGNSEEVAEWLRRLSQFPSRKMLRNTTDYAAFLEHFLVEKLPGWTADDLDEWLKALPPLPTPWEALREAEWEALRRLDIPRLLRTGPVDFLQRHRVLLAGAGSEAAVATLQSQILACARDG